MASFKKERYEFIDHMFDKLDNVPVETIVGKYVDLKRAGRHLMGLCPFHRDTKLGSFIVTPDKGMWKCFSCDEEYAGNGIKFHSLYNGMSYIDSAFEIAKEQGIITFDEYEKYSKQEYASEAVAFAKERSEKRIKAKDVKEERASQELCEKVYQVIKNSSNLSKEHKKTLINERKLSEERIKKDYFTFPYGKVKQTISAIKKALPDVSDKELSKVPGLYIDNKNNRLWMTAYKGLGILIRDANDRILAIQIRKDTLKDEVEQRYTWFSSSFAVYDKEGKYSGGSGCGSPKDVIIPDNPKTTLFITEGRFKSEIISAQRNMAVSVQGVTSWRGIDKTISAIKRKHPIKTIYICFDTDILGKHMIFIQAEKMSTELKRIFPDIKIKFCFWKKKHGKGIDDCINAGNIDKTIFLDDETPFEVCEKVFKDLLKAYGVEKLQDLKQEDVKKFEEDLQSKNEIALQLP